MSFRRRALFFAGLFVAVSCSDAGNPLEPGPKPKPQPVDALQVLECSVSVGASTMRCGVPQPSAGGALASGQLITGGQNIFVTLTASNFAVSAGGLEMDVTVQNLMRQALGTTDGVSVHPDGVRVWFFQDPAGQPTGTVTVDSMTGTALLTGDGPQPYFQYDTLLRTNETSDPKRWRFNYTGPVANINFYVYVVAQVQFENGWVEVTPQVDTVQPGETVDLNGVAYDRRADAANPPASQTLTWSSSNPDIASVDAGTGVVTGDSAGTVTITATNGTQSGTATIVVNSNVLAVTDSVDALGNVTISYPASVGLLANDTDADPAQGISVIPGTVATAEGGSATLASDGSFTYLSAPGFTGKDTIHYVVTDGVRPDSGVAIVNVGQRYWYVQPGAASNGTGTDVSPFNTLAAAGAASTATEAVLVLGGGGAPAPGAGISLETGQSLIGQGITSDLTTTLMGGAVSVTLLDGTAVSPVVRASSGAAVTLGQDNTIRGVNIETASGAAITGSAFGTLTAADMVILNPSGGPALDLTDGALDNVTIFSLSSTGSTSTGLSLANVTGSLTGTGGAISGAASSAVSVSGGSVSVTLGGNVTQGNSAALLAVSGNHTGTLAFNGTLSATAGTGLQFNDADGTYNFNGTTTLNGGDAGVDIGNGSAGTFAFAAGTGITSPSGTAFSVNGSSPSVTYSGNITQANNALLVDVSEQPGGTVTFQTGTLSATNGAGILFSNADGVVSFNGTTTLNGGDAGVDLVSGSGGSFSFAAAASITNPSGPAFSASASAPASLSYAGTISVNASRPVVIDGGCGTMTFTGSITSTGQGVLVQNCASGAVALNGTKTLNTAANQAVTLASNGTASVSFGGGNLGITTTTATGFGATGGGTVQVTGANNTIATGTGTGLTLNGVSTGASGVVFRSVSTGAAANGIALNNLTGVGVTVSGDGATAGSGGTISGTSGHGVSLTNLGSLTTGVVLNYLNVSAGAGGNAALFGSTFGPASATGTSLTGTGGPALSLSNGTMFGTFSSLASSGSASNGVLLTNVVGNVSSGGGAIVGGAAGTTFSVSGGSVSGTIASTVSQANAAQPVITIAGGHNTGTLTFSNTVSATNGTGLQFTDADGTYTFTGTLSLDGAGDEGIDIAAASAGTVNVTPSGGNTANVTSPNGIAIAIAGGSADLNYSGNVTQASNFALLSVTGGHTGDLAFPSGTLNASSGTGLQFDNADGTYDFDGTVTLAGGDAGIDVTNNSGGTFTFPTTANITSPSTGNLISILNSAPNFTYSGGLTKANNNVTGILISSNTGGTITFNGDATSADGDPADVARTISSGTAAAVNLSGNAAGTTVNFSGGGLNITSTSGAGFTATGGGTVNVTGAGNAVSSGTGTALNVQNTNIGASGLTFVSIAHSGGANGIHLASTGNLNGLQVTGTGTAGSGGTIASTTGGDGATSGNGVYLSNVTNVHLRRMQLNDHANHAVFGSSVSNVTLDTVVINGVNGTSLSGTFNEGAVHFETLSGSAIIRQSTVSGGFLDNIYVANTSGAPVLNRLQLINNTIGGTINQDGVRLNATVGTFNVTATGNNFTYWEGDAFDMLAQGTSTGDLVFQNNTAHNGNASPVSGSTNIAVGGGNFTYNISNNSFRGAAGAAVAVDESGSIVGNVSGTIHNNQIGASGVANSGSSQGSGIFVQQLGAGTSTTRVSNNTIRQINGTQAILVQASDASGGGGNGTINATVVGNNIAEEGSLAATRTAMNFNIGTVSGDAHTACLQIGGSGAEENSITNFDINRYRVQHRFNTTVRMPGYGGTAYDVTAVGNYLTPRNDIGGQALTNNSTSSGTGGGFQNTAGGASCPQPGT